ncbi:UNVERIFIED_CONTAM: hypothetical protein HCY04_04565 [Limosilactobacillus fermentum]
MPHQVLGLGWDEWGSIVAVISAVGYLLRGLLKRYVELPMQGIRNDLKRSHELQEKNLHTLEMRAEQHEKLLQSHEIKLHEQGIKIEGLEDKFK